MLTIPINTIQRYTYIYISSENIHRALFYRVYDCFIFCEIQTLETCFSSFVRLWNIRPTRVSTHTNDPYKYVTLTVSARRFQLNIT